MIRTHDLELRWNYADDLVARRAFQDFLVHIHGLDLRPWEAAGYWGDDYRQFSYFDTAGRVVSSVNLFSLDLIVDGAPCRAAQLSGVGTLESRRRQGLNRELTAAALAWARREHDLVFLFAAPEAVPFYQRCEFQPVEESTPYVAVEPRPPRPGLRRIDITDPAERDRLYQRARARTPVSNRLGARAPELFMYHAMCTVTDALYEIADLDLVVACRTAGERTTVYDLVGPTLPRFTDLSPFLATPETREIAFCFEPDTLDVPDLRRRPLPDNCLHDRGEFALRGQPFLFPFTSHA